MKLKKIYSNIIPFEGYLAVTIWPFVFIRKELAHKFTPAAERHENTHGYQQLECLWILFFIIYFLEWIIKGIICFFANKNAYRSISFEQEAYEHEDEVYYNDVRKHYTWVKYIFKLK